MPLLADSANPNPANPNPAKPNPVKRRLPSVLLSVAAHAGVLALALLAGSMAGRKLTEPAPHTTMTLLETAGGSHRIKIELPVKDFAAHTRRQSDDQTATRKSTLPTPLTQPRMTGGGETKAPQHGDGSGQAVTGNGSDAEDARPAFPTFSPRPPVTERSLLPAGEEKIVVDVNVDADGQVIGETLVKGLGTKLDQIVLDTVKTWRFQPATVNGKPIASEAELIFPFTPDSPLTVS